MQPNNSSDQNQPQAAPPPQQWVPMQYPPAMVMPPQMMPPPHFSPHYVPYHPAYHRQPYHHHPPPQKQGSNGGENKTIWVGDLLNWMEEDYLHNCFASGGEIVSIKIIRNKHNGLSEGYGFVEFLSNSAAEKVLQNYAGKVMPNTDQPFRLNWAAFSTGDKRANNGSDLSIFVGDLAADVTDALLLETFTSKYSSVKAAKVIIDVNTGCSKGYGFVRFGDENERSQAMTEMNGVNCSSRAMRIGPATPRKSSGYPPQFSPHGGSGHGSQGDGDSPNTTIFVGGLDASITDEDLRQSFSQYGEVVSVKIPVGKGCGFVHFANRKSAEEALQKLNGTTIGKQTVRLSWGRNPANKQMRGGEFGGSPWNGPYYGRQMYEGYGGYPMPPHDPRMYAAAAAYGGYPFYGAPQQRVS